MQAIKLEAMIDESHRLQLDLPAEVADHIIFNRAGYFSFLETGRL